MNMMQGPMQVTPEVTETLLASARRVLTSEASALNAAAAFLKPSFAEAVAKLVNCKGRVITSGMGKSGHVARKIAATLASTGTPAQFVHPGEASHGDLGMVTENDVVVLLSNSGEAPELSDLVAYTRRFGITLIGMTGREESSLGKSSDIVLLMPPEKEVCPLGLAPTTSTTMMLAFGDALAIAALESKGFTADDYRNFHPGGKLGKKLLRVEAIMHGGAELPLVKGSDKMSDVLVVMSAKAFGCVIIVDSDGKLEGIVTDGDLRRHMSDNLPQKTAAEVMTKDPMTIGPKALAVEALKALNETKRTQILVVDGETPVGLLHVHDLLRAGIV